MFVFFIILKILLYALAAIVLLILLLLTLPFTYSTELAVTQGVRFNYHLGWPWRMIKIKGTIDDSQRDAGIYINNWRIMKLSQKLHVIKEKGKEQAEEAAEEVEEDIKRGRLRDYLEKAFINDVLVYIKKLLKILKPKYLYIKGTYGFDDPSLTGMVCGVTAALKGLMPEAQIYLNPDFTEEVFEIDFKLAGRMRMGSLLFVTLKTVMKKSIRGKFLKKKAKASLFDFGKRNHTYLL